MNFKQFYTGRVIGFVVVVAVALGVFAVWKPQSSAPTVSTTTQVDKTALAQLQ